MRTAECGIAGTGPSPDDTYLIHSAFRTPHSALEFVVHGRFLVRDRRRRDRTDGGDERDPHRARSPGRAAGAWERAVRHSDRAGPPELPHLPPPPPQIGRAHV